MTVAMSTVQTLAEFPWAEIGGATGIVAALAMAAKGIRDWRSGRAKGVAEADRAELDNAERVASIALNTLLGPLEERVDKLTKTTNELSQSLEEARAAEARAHREAEQFRSAWENAAAEVRRLGAYVEILLADIRGAQRPVPAAPELYPDVEGGAGL